MANDIKLPKGEILWVSYHNRKGDVMFILTSKQVRDYYYLYEITDAGLKKLGRERSPSELEEKFNVDERLDSS